jgi:hypothetical protein
VLEIPVKRFPIGRLRLASFLNRFLQLSDPDAPAIPRNDLTEPGEAALEMDCGDVSDGERLHELLQSGICRAYLCSKHS